MQSWRRYRGTKTYHEIFRRKHESACAVFPDTLERELERAVRTHGEPVLRDRRSRHVAAEPLELASVAPVDDLASVHVDAADFGDGVVGVVGGKIAIDRDDESERLQAPVVSGNADALCSLGVAGGEARLFYAELGWLFEPGLLLVE